MSGKKSLGPAYRIETERMVLRCWQPTDAPKLKKAVDRSKEHLLPWMPWAAHDPEPVENKVALLRRFRGQFDLEQDFVYGIFSPDESEVWGGTGIHERIGPDACEIGYWIDITQVGKGLATEVSCALTQVAFELHKFHRVEIRCEPSNHASSAIPKKIGFRHEATLKERFHLGNGHYRDQMIWSMFFEDYPGSIPSKGKVRTFDAVGHLIKYTE